MLARQDRVRFEAEMAEYTETRKYLRSKGCLDDAVYPILAPLKKPEADCTFSAKGDLTQIGSLGAYTPSSEKPVDVQRNTDSTAIEGLNNDPFEPMPWTPRRPPSMGYEDSSFWMHYDPLYNVSEIVKRLDSESQDFLIRAFLP